LKCKYEHLDRFAFHLDIQISALIRANGVCCAYIFADGDPLYVGEPEVCGDEDLAIIFVGAWCEPVRVEWR
jgi:uncharacterized protein YcsI (UPF0317 family)